MIFRLGCTVNDLLEHEHGTTEPETRSTVSYCWHSKIPYSHLSSSSVLRPHHLIIDLVIDQTKSASATRYPLKPIPISAVAGFPYSQVGASHRFPVSTGKRALTEAICTMARQSSSIMTLVVSMDIQ